MELVDPVRTNRAIELLFFTSGPPVYKEHKQGNRWYTECKVSSLLDSVLVGKKKEEREEREKQCKHHHCYSVVLSSSLALLGDGGLLLLCKHSVRR